MTDIIGHSWDETLNGTDGDDAITALGGADTVYARRGDDTVDGGNGLDRVFGGAGSDSILGGAGADVLYAAEEDVDDEAWPTGDFAPDTLEGGFGNDYILASYDDHIDGGAGSDNVLLSALELAEALDLDLDLSAQRGPSFDFGAIGGRITGAEVVILRLTNGGDRILLGAAEAEVRGEDGDDTLTGGSGADTIVGGDGVDVSRGGAGNDFLEGFDATDYDTGDVIAGGDGDDTVSGAVNDTVSGGAGIDFVWLDTSRLETNATARQNADGSIEIRSGTTLTRAQGVETGGVRLGIGDDVMRLSVGGDIMVDGYHGDDTIFGSSNADLIADSEGNDVYAGKGGTDTVSYAFSFAFGLTVDLVEGIGLARIDGHRDTFASVENVVGLVNDANVLFGNAADNVLTGGSASDTLNGRGGDDTLSGVADDPFGDNSADVLSGGSGNDMLFGGFDGDTLAGGTGADTYLYTSATDSDAYGRDIITVLEAIDIIDLSAIDALPRTEADDPFVLAEAPTTVPGSIYWTYDIAADVSTLWLVPDGGVGSPRSMTIEAAGDQRGFDNFIV